MANKPSTIGDLQARIDQLEDMLRRVGIRDSQPRRAVEQTDYVKHGSDEHAALLGLKKASESDDPQVDGWALEDITQFGPTVTPAFLAQWLRQKVNELTMQVPEPQSTDPRAPNFAPRLWRPDRGQSFRKITE